MCHPTFVRYPVFVMQDVSLEKLCALCDRVSPQLYVAPEDEESLREVCACMCVCVCVCAHLSVNDHHACREADVPHTPL